MLKTEKIEKLVRYAIISGFLKRDTAPLSLMLIAPPESNKTSILKGFESLKSVKYTVDLSSRPLVEFLKNAAKDKYYHLVVPDFIKVVKHNAIVSQAVVATLNAAIEEGIKTGMYYGQEFDLKKDVKIGLITSITPDLFIQQFRAWNALGFLTRFLPVSYEYSSETRLEISKLISGNGVSSFDKQLAKIRKSGQKDIPIMQDVSAGILLYTEDLTKKLREWKIRSREGGVERTLIYDIQGFRLQKQLRLLAKCIAFDRKLDQVNYECLEELKGLLEYVNSPASSKVL